MILLQDVKTSPLSPCHYLPGETWKFEYFFAKGLNQNELEWFLSRGWRKFGLYYFRPACPTCRKCVPLRVLVHDFTLTRSQKRLVRKNMGIRESFGPLNYSQRVYEIYRDHSGRFEKDISDPPEFISSFYTESCPSLQSEYHVGETLAAVGFLDHSSHGLSSVYFVFDTSFSRYSFGTYSIIREIDYAKELGLSYYYLGYYIAECSKMAYKYRFHPCEIYDWESGIWKTPGGINPNNSH